MRLAVSATIESSIGRDATARMRSLILASASRPQASRFPSRESIVASSCAAGTRALSIPMRNASSASNTSAVRK